jgi:hypothetical protein
MNGKRYVAVTLFGVQADCPALGVRCLGCNTINAVLTSIGSLVETQSTAELWLSSVR